MSKDDRHWAKTVGQPWGFGGAGDGMGCNFEPGRSGGLLRRVLFTVYQAQVSHSQKALLNVYFIHIL